MKKKINKITNKKNKTAALPTLVTKQVQHMMEA